MRHAFGTSLILIVTLAGAGCAAPPEREADAPVHPKSYAEEVPGSTASFEMIWVPAGAFWIGRTEVTWDEYLVFCAFDDPLPEGVDALSRPSKPLEVHPYDRHWGKGRRPAVGMSKNGAERYCAWLSERTGHRYRLPTEAEWSLALGDAPGAVREYAWYAANSRGRTQPVATRRPNAHGLHDMLGNLWEYCADPFAPDQPERAVLRGGSWKDAALAPDARLGFEPRWVMDDPGFPPGIWWVPDGDHLGFRLLREQEPQAEEAR